jgi:hypothetical protein
MRSSLFATPLLACVLAVSFAAAQPVPAGTVPAVAPQSPPRGAPAATPAASQNGDTDVARRQLEWQQKYAEARARMLEGSFAEAASLFQVAVAAAPGPVEQALALENLALARAWAERGVMLAPRGTPLLPPTGPALDERTADEMAVLYTNSVFYGLGSGVWLAALTKPDSTAGAILPALGLAGGAAFGVGMWDGSHRLRYGVPQSIVSGMYLGLEEGVVLAFWNQARVRRVDEWEPETVATVIWGLSTAGAIAGGVVGSLRGTTPGRASFIGSAGLWTASVVGLATAALTTDDDKRDDNALLAAGLSLNAGVIAGLAAAGPVSPSIARVRFIDLGGIAGGILLGGLYLAAADKHPKDQPLMGALSLGMAGGLGLAWALTGKMEPDRGMGGVEMRRSVLDVSPTIVPERGGAVLAVRGSL